MTAVSKAVRRQVIERDQGRCVVTGAFVVDPDTLRPYGQFSIHHRRPRGMGGSKDPAVNSPANLLLLSGTGTTGAHGWVESHRAEAVDQGLIVSQAQSPELVPVMHWLYGLSFLTRTGWEPIPQGPEGLLVVAERARQIAKDRGLDDPTHISQTLHDLTVSWVQEGAA